LGVVEYTLTISSTAGGSIAAPGDGEFTYNAGVVIRLIAKLETGYRLVNRGGETDTIASVNAATATNFALSWPLIGGIVGVVVVAAAAAGLAIFFVRIRRAVRTERQSRRRRGGRKR
jgi:hypothetical protein